MGWLRGGKFTEEPGRSCNGLSFSYRLLRKMSQNEAGDWLTPKEFLMEGKMSKSKDWKRDIQCKQKTLRFLEQVC